MMMTMSTTGLAVLDGVLREFHEGLSCERAAISSFVVLEQRLIPFSAVEYRVVLRCAMHTFDYGLAGIEEFRHRGFFLAINGLQCLNC